MGTFDGLQIGTTGLFAARQGVETAGQNIANLNTPGYSRQRVDLTADSGPVTPAIHSRWEGSGLGVRDVEVRRLRDQFLDRRAREEGSFEAELDEHAKALGSIERVFAEPSDTGLASVLAEFLASWDDVSNRPDDPAARAQLAERGLTLATDLGQLKGELTSIRDVAVGRLDSIVSEVNTAAKQVAEIQRTLVASKASGLNANELEDQRDLLLQDLAEKTGGRARLDDSGNVSFFIGSVALVRGDRALELGTEYTPTGVDVVWPQDGRSSGVTGRLGGLLETANVIVPDHLAKMEDVETTLATEVNALHTTAFDANGDPGGDFFVVGPAGIEMNQAILDDPSLVAVSSAPGLVDGSVAGQIAQLTGTEDAYREVVVRLGVESLSASRRFDLQNAVVTQVQTEQESVNGVNLDEELANLVKFQRAYEANGRFIRTVDSLLDVIVNRLGV